VIEVVAVVGIAHFAGGQGQALHAPVQNTELALSRGLVQEVPVRLVTQSTCCEIRALETVGKEAEIAQFVSVIQEVVDGSIALRAGGQR
jgi:hypothetical protein